MFQSLKYDAGYFVYNKITNLLPMLTGLSYLPSNPVINIVFKSDDILDTAPTINEAKKLIAYANNNQQELIYLLNDSFPSKTVKYLSLFKQTNIRFIRGEIIITVQNYDDLINLYKIWYFLKFATNVDSYIPIINTQSEMASLLAQIDVFKNIDETINKLIDNWIIDPKIVNVILTEEGNLYLAKIPTRLIIQILYKYPTIMLQGNISDLSISLINNNVTHDPNNTNALKSDNPLIDASDIIFCLDEQVTREYEPYISDLYYKVVDLPSSLSVYIVHIQDNDKIHASNLICPDLSKALSTNYQLTQSPMFPEFGKDNRYFVSDLPNMSKQPDTLLITDSGMYKASDLNFNFWANLFNGGKQDLGFSNPWTSLEIGLMLDIFAVLQKGNIIMGLQDECDKSLFEYSNTKLQKRLNIYRPMWLIRLLIQAGIMDTIFSSSHLHGLGSSNNAVIKYNSSFKMFTFINNVFYIAYDLILNKMGLIRYSPINQFVINNTVLTIANINPISLNVDGTISDFKYPDYDDKDLDKILMELNMHGFTTQMNMWSLISNIKNTVFRDMCYSLYLAFNHKFSLFSGISAKYGIRHLTYSSLCSSPKRVYAICGPDKYTQIFKEFKCSAPTKYVSFNFNCLYFQLNFMFDSIVQHKAYVQHIVTYSHLSANALNLNIRTSRYLERMFLNDMSISLTTRIYHDALADQHNANVFLQLDKQCFGGNVQITGGFLHHAPRSNVIDLKIVNYDPISPDFIKNNFVYAVRNVEDWSNITDDIMLVFEYRRLIKDTKSHVTIRAYLDCLIIKDAECKILLDFEIQYTKILLEFFGLRIGIVGMLRLLRDNPSPIRLGLI